MAATKAYLPPQYKTTNEIGDLLKRIYALPEDQNKHIDYFYIRVPEKEKTIVENVIPDLKGMLGDDFCALVDEDWPGFILVCFVAGENESEREEKLDKEIRYPMANSKLTMVTFSRACLYHNYEIVQESVTTNDIGEILDPQSASIVQSPHQASIAQSPHQDFFYLTVRFKDRRDADIYSVLKTLPGEWRKVEPQTTWPRTFIGHFPRSPFDKSEREREARLNREVRLPLMKSLEEKLATTFPKDGEVVKRKVLVLITRACKPNSANTGNKIEI